MTNSTQKAPFDVNSVVDVIVQFFVKENTEKNTKPGVVCKVVDTNYTVFVDELELVTTPKVGNQLKVQIMNSWRPRQKPSRNPDGLNWLASQRSAALAIQEQGFANFMEAADKLFGSEMTVVVENDNRAYNEDIWGIWASISPSDSNKVRVYMNPRPFDDHNLPVPVGEQIRVIVEDKFQTPKGFWVLKAKPVLQKDAEGKQALSILSKEVQG